MRKSRPIQNSILIIAVCLITGCASIINPQKSTNVLVTEPSNAEVYDNNNVKIGNTPYNLNTVPMGVKLLKLKLEGYQDAELGIRRDANNGILFLDAMLLCIPCPFDLNSKSLYSFQPVNPTIRLRKRMSEKDNSVRVAIDKVSMDTKSGSIGKLNSSVLRMSDKNTARTIGSVDEQDEMVKTALTKSSFEPYYLSSVDNIKSSMNRPRVLITPVIRDLDLQLKGKILKDYTGEEKVQMEWKFSQMSNKSKTLGSITTNTRFYRNSGSNDRVLDQLMYEATQDLLENDTLYDYLQKLDKDYMMATKGSSITINTGTKPKYDATKDALKGSKLAVVTVLSKDGFGSGSIISPDGYVLTNYHVIEDDKNITVRMNSNVKMKATIVKSNKDYDLALLKIEAEDLKTIPLANSEKAESGDEVYAIGTPMDESLGQSVTKGIISGERELNGVKFLQTDVSINPGNSGGPLINDKGEMIGMATMKLSGEGIEGIGFCIPTNTIVEMLNIKFQN